MRVSVEVKGDLSRTKRFLTNAMKTRIDRILDEYGRAGVSALASATPTDSGNTASSWNYVVTSSLGKHEIWWTNSNIVDGVPIAVIIQYGHGTNNGGYVQGRNYINPAIRPIFDKIADKSWRAVTSG